MIPRLIIEFCTLENHQQNHSERIIGSVGIRPVQENLKTKMADLTRDEIVTHTIHLAKRPLIG